MTLVELNCWISKGCRISADIKKLQRINNATKI